MTCKECLPAHPALCVTCTNLSSMIFILLSLVYILSSFWEKFHFQRSEDLSKEPPSHCDWEVLPVFTTKTCTVNTLSVSSALTLVFLPKQTTRITHERRIVLAFTIFVVPEFQPFSLMNNPIPESSPWELHSFLCVTVPEQRSDSANLDIQPQEPASLYLTDLVLLIQLDFQHESSEKLNWAAELMNNHFTLVKIFSE